MDPNTFDLRDFDTKFDSIMIDAPLEEYQRTLGCMREKYMSWEEVYYTNIPPSKFTLFYAA